MNTNTQEALAKVASISSMLEDFAKSIATQKINIYPITRDVDYYDEDVEDADDYAPLIEGENLGCCTGCMDCLGLSWADFV
jgi:hypothetical protein